MNDRKIVMYVCHFYQHILSDTTTRLETIKFIWVCIILVVKMPDFLGKEQRKTNDDEEEEKPIQGMTFVMKLYEFKSF